MASRIALLCLLGLLQLAAAALPATAIAANDTGIYYQLGLVWPGAYCEQTRAGCCKPSTGVKTARDFYITGLTVFNATTDDEITECSNRVPYNPNKIIALEGLDQYWSNIKCPSNDGQRSWRSIWNKYGACSGLNETDYFKKALSFRSRINPLVRLNASGVRDDFDLYSLKVIKRAFKSKSGGISASPVIQCSKGPFDKYMLYKLYFCANWNGTFIDCPAPPQYTCTKTILFHPFKKWMLKEPQQKQQHLDDDDDTFELPGLAMDN